MNSERPAAPAKAPNEGHNASADSRRLAVGWNALVVKNRMWFHVVNDSRRQRGFGLK
ncbi:MAG: hypothetical protein KGL39_33635 [Patescibacteria group bacterium]|nr:hypothetical protein [Patescibacteria group bacterium]